MTSNKKQQSSKLNSSNYANLYKDNRNRYLRSRLKHTNHYLSTVFVNIVNTTGT